MRHEDSNLSALQVIPGIAIKSLLQASQGRQISQPTANNDPILSPPRCRLGRPLSSKPNAVAAIVTMAAQPLARVDQRIVLYLVPDPFGRYHVACCAGD